MSQYPDAHPGPDPGLARAVSADLEGIFRPAAAPAAARGARVRSLRPAGEPREGRRARLGAMAATALAGLAIGALAAKLPNPDREASRGAVLAAAPAPAARIAVPPIDPAPPAAPPTKVEPAQVKVAEAGAEPAPTRLRPQKAKATAGPDRARSARYRCAGLRGDAEARCAYPAVMAADRSLRAAYDRAVRAGVPRSTLVSYRSRWARLRHRADDQPARVISDYRRMAEDLNRLSRDVV